MNIEQEGLVLLKYVVGKLEELELVRGKVGLLKERFLLTIGCFLSRKNG